MQSHYEVQYTNSQSASEILCLQFMEISAHANIFKTDSIAWVDICKYDHTLARQTDISYERSHKQSGSVPATKIQKVSRWKAIFKNTKEWHNAHGTLYFYPETSICNLRFTQEEKSVFKDRFLDDWSKVDEGSDKESHSDNDEDQEKDDD